MSWMRNMAFVMAAAAAGWTSGCWGHSSMEEDAGVPIYNGDTDELPIADPSGGAFEEVEVEPSDTCLDSDGDGYGVNCEMGLDCDDENADVNCADSCARRHAGCPCDEEGRVELCRTFGPLDSIDGVDLCYQGSRTCSEGVWGHCEDMVPYPFDTEEESSSENGVHRQPVLGRAEPCSGSTCDTSCTLVRDCISAPDLGRENAENLIYDVRGAPPAVILREVDEVGVFHRSIEHHCGEGEAVTWWALDFDLRAESPQAITLRVRTADTESALYSADWLTIARCPEGPCKRPQHTNDRDYGQGNLFEALSSETVHQSWIEIEVSLTAGTGGTSPRYLGHWLSYYCDPVD